jgi:hypothetical protein
MTVQYTVQISGTGRARGATEKVLGLYCGVRVSSE